LKTAKTAVKLKNTFIHSISKAQTKSWPANLWEIHSNNRTLSNSIERLQLSPDQL